MRVCVCVCVCVNISAFHSLTRQLLFFSAANKCVPYYARRAHCLSCNLVTLRSLPVHCLHTNFQTAQRTCTFVSCPCTALTPVPVLTFTLGRFPAHIVPSAPFSPWGSPLRPVPRLLTGRGLASVMLLWTVDRSAKLTKPVDLSRNPFIRTALSKCIHSI